jgi:hypothetical protein
MGCASPQRESAEINHESIPNEHFSLRQPVLCSRYVSRARNTVVTEPKRAKAPHGVGSQIRTPRQKRNVQCRDTECSADRAAERIKPRVKELDDEAPQSHNEIDWGPRVKSIEMIDGDDRLRRIQRHRNVKRERLMLVDADRCRRNRCGRGGNRNEAPRRRRRAKSRR